MGLNDPIRIIAMRSNESEGIMKHEVEIWNKPMEGFYTSKYDILHHSGEMNQIQNSGKTVL